MARLFIGNERHPDGAEIALPELLDRTKLDFSLDSLHEVDRYLGALHQRRGELGADVAYDTVLWCGAYVGEVVRRQSALELHWIGYDDYVALHPEVREIVGPPDVGTCAFVVQPSGAMNVPIGKVHQRLVNGLEDSLHFHAYCELSQQRRA